MGGGDVSAYLPQIPQLKHIHTLARIFDKHHLHPPSSPGEDRLSEDDTSEAISQTCRALTSSSRQGPKQEEPVTPQESHIIDFSLSFLCEGGVHNDGDQAGNESRGLIFCQNHQESMLQYQSALELNRWFVEQANRTSFVSRPNFARAFCSDLV